MRRDATAEHVKHMMPQGRAAKKKGGRHSKDALCTLIHRKQIQNLVVLDILDANEAQAILDMIAIDDEHWALI